jgi:hypothetical protein
MLGICAHVFLLLETEDMEFEVSTAVKMSIVVFWVVMSCIIVGDYSVSEERISSIFRVEVTKHL